MLEPDALYGIRATYQSRQSSGFICCHWCAPEQVILFETRLQSETGNSCKGKHQQELQNLRWIYLPSDIDHAHRLCASDDFEVKVDGSIYACDYTIVNRCLCVPWRAKLRNKNGGVKMHTLNGVKTRIPSFVHMTTVSVMDVKAVGRSPCEKDCY